MTLPRGVQTGAKGRYGAAYYAGVANILGNYGEQRQALNAQQGAVAISTIGAISQTLQQGFESYRNYATAMEEVQYKRDRDVIQDRQWQQKLELENRTAMLTEAHLKLENERTTMELVKLRKATDLEGPTTTARMGFAAAAQDLRSQLSALRTDGIVNPEKVQEARKYLGDIRDGLKAQTYQFPGMNLAEEYGELDKLDAAISDTSMVTLNGERVSIATVSTSLDMVPHGDVGVARLKSLMDSTEVGKGLRDIAADRFAKIQAGIADTGWAEYDKLSERQRRDLKLKADLLDEHNQRLLQSARANNDQRSVPEIIYGASATGPESRSPAGTLPEPDQTKLRAMKKDIYNRADMPSGIHDEILLTPSQMAVAMTEVRSDVPTDVLFGRGPESDRLRAQTTKPMHRFFTEADPGVVAKRVEVYAGSMIATAALSDNVRQQELVLIDLATTLSSKALQDAYVKGRPAGTIPYSELFATRSSSLSLALDALSRSRNTGVSGAAQSLISLYATPRQAAAGELTLQNLSGAPVTTVPATPASAAAPIVKPLPGLKTL